jgi:hypothetical protein
MKLSLSLPLSLLSLAACACARFEATCKDIKITSTGVITARCDDGNAGSKDASIDLKDCYTYFDEQLIVSPGLHTHSCTYTLLLRRSAARVVSLCFTRDLG